MVRSIAEVFTQPLGKAAIERRAVVQLQKVAFWDEASLGTSFAQVDMGFLIIPSSDKVDAFFLPDIRAFV